MNKIKRSTEEEHQEAISLMENFLPPASPKLGIFWYDYINEQLFGVEKRDVTDTEMKSGMHTLEKLHRTYWQKWHHRAVARNETDSIFYQQHNYTLIPRGRIFLTNGIFTARVGNWIEDGIDGHKIDAVKLHDLICDEFDLPEDFDFVIDEHWNLGHGWSENDFTSESNTRVFKLKDIQNHASEELAIKAVVERASSPTLRSFTKEQITIINEYLSSFSSEKKHDVLNDIWQVAEKILNDNCVNKRWQEDAYEELLGIANGETRERHSGYRR